MPRKAFRLAPDAAARVVDCEKYDLNNGAPRCDALTHPWCLAPGESPLSFKFRVPKDQKAAGKPRKKKQHEAD